MKPPLKTPRLSLTQRFITSLVPRSMAEDMERHSRAWKIRCCTCGAEKSIWDIGGIRYKAYSKGKYTLTRCIPCGCIRRAEVYDSRRHGTR
jgi:hypothetical protein